MIAPKFNVGDKFYIASTKQERKQHDCPDCLGEQLFKAIAPSGDEFTIDCPRCSGNTWVRDVPALTYSHHVPEVIACEIVGYCVNEHGKAGITYRSGRGYTVHEDELIADEAKAHEIAGQKAALANAKEAAKPERIHHDHLASLRLREAAQDQFKNGLYASWSTFRYLREGVEEIIEDEGGDYYSRDAVVEALRERLSQTMRYEFIFEGFTRAMEAVVALISADDATAPTILEALRGQWAGLPEEVQKAWQPPACIAKDWSGKPCPTY